MTYAPFMRRCPKGHPMEETGCLLCEQDRQDQERADDKLYDALERLAKRGKLAGLFPNASH